MITPHILHIFYDEKVVNNFISMMDTVYPGESDYIIFGTTDAPCKVTIRENVRYFKSNSKSLIYTVSNTSQYSHVCLHSIRCEKFYKYIHHHSISWVIWGADLYERLLRFEGYQIYFPKNEQYIIRANAMPTCLYKFLTFIRDYRKYKNQKKLIRKLKYIITDNGCDYDVFKNYYPTTQILHLGTINYYPIENLVGEDNKEKVCSGSAIWVGNSAAPNGNHMSVLRRLACLNIDSEVYVPLSYGDTRIANFVEKEGALLLGSRFKPLIDFLPVQQYYSLFLNANSFVFGHYRQCAVGNILMALYFGGKVFLFEKNPLLEMYRKFGFIIFSIDNDLSETEVTSLLTLKQRKKNRDLVLRIASYQSSLDQIKHVYQGL